MWQITRVAQQELSSKIGSFRASAQVGKRQVRWKSVPNNYQSIPWDLIVGFARSASPVRKTQKE
ncbi:hypothetical protein KCP70_06395 [Salmonella enterica subsp. enterica]|nr:hypothetical protein KCP70_06395 [Salmonella enterica subsp. enterica]